MGGTTYGIRKLILTFLGWDGIGNSNWYIFCILWLYLFTYIAFTVFDNRKKAVCVVTLQSIIYMGIMNVYKDSWWWDTTLCYVLGMWYYIYKEKIECFVDENAKTWLCSLGICSGMLCMAYLNRDNVFAYQVMILSFTLLTLFITMHIKIGNRVLVWLGENLFELYILQRLPMKIFRDLGLAQRNRYIYVVVCLLCTIIMSILFKKIISANIQFGNEGKIEKG